MDSDSLSETSSVLPIAEKIRINRTEILPPDEMVEDSDSDTDYTSMKQQNFKMSVSGISSLLNFGEIDCTENVSISDLNLIEPMHLDEVSRTTNNLNNENENFKNKSRKKIIRTCRKLTSKQKDDSESDSEDFSPSDGSDFNPDSGSHFSDDSMNVVYLSDVKNHPHNKRFWKKSILDKQRFIQDNNSSLELPFLTASETDDRVQDPEVLSNYANLDLNCINKQTTDHELVSNEDKYPMTIIRDMYEAQDDTEESDSDCENKRPVQPESKDQKKKRTWNRRNACIYCESVVTNFTRHIIKHHKNESEVLQYISINDPDPKVRKQRRRKLADDLRNRGNFLHNSKVIFEKEGNLIPKKGNYPLSSPSTFTTCKNCLGTFKRKYFYKHFKTCGSNILNLKNIPSSYKTRVLANHSISIIPHLSAASQEVKNQILPRLRNDDISTIVKTDPLILAYGSRLMKKKKEARNRKAVCSKLRDLANLLLHLKTEDPSIQALSDLFKPQHYSTFITCVKKICGFNEETGHVKTISIPSRLRPSILGCIEVLYTEMIMGHESQGFKETLKKQLDEFKLLIQINWEWEIASNAEKTRKRNLITKETVMPLDEDIKTITEKLHELEKKYSKLLKKDVTVMNYENLCEVTIAHIIVMDKKRAGDVAEAELCFYLNRKEEQTPPQVLQLLTQEQKDAIDELDVFMIPGKRTRSVPVLLTKQMRRNIDHIVASRKSVGVADNNPLLFARPLTSRPFDGGKCLNKIKNMCKLINPTMLTSTGVRHHVATMSQLHSKKSDQYTEHLAGFLGHDLAVHSSNYRLPLQVIQKAIIGSSLMEFENKKKNESVTSESMNKKIDESNNNIEYIEGQLKDTQENYLAKHYEIKDVTNTSPKERCEGGDGQILVENEKSNIMIEKNQDEEEILKINTEKANEIEELVEVKSCTNTNIEEDDSKLYNKKTKSATKGNRNVKGHFQVDPHKSKRGEYQLQTCYEKSPLRNASNNNDEEYEMIKLTETSNRFYSRKSSSETNDEKKKVSKIKNLKRYKQTKKSKTMNLSEESTSSSDDLQDRIEPRRRKKTHTRWTNEELKAVRTHFKQNIKNKTNPGKAKCLQVLKEVPVLSKRTWMQLNTQVNNIYKKK